MPDKSFVDLTKFDFGFTFTDEDEVEKAQSTAKAEQDRSELLQSKMDELYEAIMPFLENLCKNPEKATIHWPDRVAKIREYQQKLTQIKNRT